MRNTVKITLLVLVALLVAAGVLIYVKTIVSPPQKADIGHRYEEALQQEVDALPGALETEGSDVNYLRMRDLIQLFYDERVIDTKTHDKYLAEYIRAYAPPYASKCYEYFNRSKWSDANIKAMEDRVHELRGVRNPSGSPVIIQSTNDSLRNVLDVINGYRQAQRLVGSTSYTGESAARSVIDQVTKLSTDPYLNHNKDLVAALSRVPARIGESHFRSLQRSVYRLNSYMSLDQDSFMTLFREVLDDISGYEAIAVELYGSCEDTYKLKTDADEYRNRAVVFYAAQEQQPSQSWSY